MTDDLHCSTPDNKFKVRIITPSLARTCAGVDSIPLLRGGVGFTSRMTLGELRDDVAALLGLPQGVRSYCHDDQECNCAFSRRIYDDGLWEKVDCQCHVAPGTASHNCLFPGTNISGGCVICSRPISDHRCGDVEPGDGISVCSAKLFIRRDISCGHLHHSSCVKPGEVRMCPTSCFACESRRCA